MSNAKRRHRRRYRFNRQWVTIVEEWHMFNGYRIRILQHRRTKVITWRGPYA